MQTILVILNARLKKTLLLWLGMAILLPAMSQHGNVWAIGHKRGLNFNTKPVSLISTAIVNDTFSNYLDETENIATASVSYADCNGNLLVYGSQQQLWNKNHKLLKNGSFDQNWPFGLLLIPMPNDSRYLYFFYHTADGACSNFKLRYAIIDLNGDNGLGEVIDKDKIVGNGGGTCLTYTKQGNSNNIWIVHGSSDKITNCYLLSDTGLNTNAVSSNVYSFSQCAGPKSNYNYLAGTIPFSYSMKMTRDGKNLVCSGVDSSTTKLGCVLMYDFNNLSGQINNPQVLMKFSDIPSKTGAYQGNYFYNEISPNDSFIYVADYGTNKLTIVQINRASRKKVIVNRPANSIWGFQMGPDGQIYYFSSTASRRLDLYAITKPNLSGTNCAIRKILSDSFIEFRLPPQTYEPYRQLTFSTTLEDQICQDTVGFTFQVDTGFQNLSVYFGDGDSVVYSSPLKSVYRINHVYKRTGSYYLKLKAKNPVCNTFSYTQDSIFYAKPPKLFNTTKTSVAGCKSAKFYLKDSFLNTTRIVYTWGPLKKDTFNVINSSNTINEIIERDSGISEIKWTVTVGNSECLNFATYSDSLKLDYLEVPKQNYLLNGLKTDTIKACLPFKVDITNKSNNSSSASVKWGDGTISNVLSPYALVQKSYNASGLFKGIVSDTSKDNCVSVDSFFINVLNKPSVWLSAQSKEQCYNENRFLVVAQCNQTVDYFWDLPNGSVYQQNKYSITQLNLPKVGFSMVKVIVSDTEGCKDTALTTLRLMPELRAVFSGDSSGKCLKDNSFSINHDKDISNNALPVKYFYDRLNSSFEESTGKIKYQQSGLYQFRYVLTDSLGCRDSLEIHHHVFSQPELTLLVKDTCFGNSVKIDYKSNMALSFLKLSSGDGKDYSTPTDHQYKHAGKYRTSLIAKSKQGCEDSIFRFIEIYENPVAGLVSDSVCLGDVLTLLPICNNIPWDSLVGMDISWDNGSKHITSAGNINIPASSVGSITVRNIVRSNHNCSDTVSVDALVYELPRADFKWVRVGSSSDGIEVQFNDNSTNAKDHLWDFGDGNLSDFSENPLHRYVDSGTYKISLRVSNEKGCTDEKNQPLRVLPFLPVYVPTAFSPNNDGINDVFIPSGSLLLKSWELTIYNRWGEIVYQVNDTGWDGTDFEKEACIEGVYVYRLSIQSVDNKRSHSSGTVHLER